MPIDLHYICKRGENFKRIGERLFETGNWTASDSLASLAVVVGSFCISLKTSLLGTVAPSSNFDPLRHLKKKGRFSHTKVILNIRFFVKRPGLGRSPLLGGITTERGYYRKLNI